MTIVTQFNVGDQVLIVEDSAVRWAEIVKVNVEVNGYMDMKEPKPLVTYYFADRARRSGGDLYRYESEVAGSPEELMVKLAPKVKPEKDLSK